MRRLPFVDWMKALGMLLIVYGHSSAGFHLFTTDPIYVKQLGVAFFVFVTGFTLARECRSTAYVVFSRLFGVCLYGLGFAMVMSIVGLVMRGDPAESNYLPFCLGANVFVDAFPANSTTWYLGTYLHIVLLWALVLRRIRLRWWMLWAWIPWSIAARSALLADAGQYIAYMLITNWITALLLGMLSAETSPRNATGDRAAWRQVAPVVGLGMSVLVIWPVVVGVMSFDKGFPFRLVQLGSPLASLLGTSLLVELIYLLGTLFVYRLALMLPASRMVEFFARNTLVIFIVHMPLMKVLSPYVGQIDNGYVRVLVNVMIYYVMLACAGEFLGALIRRTDIQSACLGRLQRVTGIAFSHDYR